MRIRWFAGWAGYDVVSSLLSNGGDFVVACIDLTLCVGWCFWFCGLASVVDCVVLWLRGLFATLGFVCWVYFWHSGRLLCVIVVVWCGW